MRCGVSTSCFFPEDTLRSLQKVVQIGSPVTEVFLNTFSEVEEDYVQALRREVRRSGIQVVAVHPFSSMLDGFFFASPYATRLQDGLRLFKRYFEVCQALGADKLNFHGDHDYSAKIFPDSRYVEHFGAIAALGREYGVTLCHENVSYCRLGNPEAVRGITPLLGEDAAFTLDIKQVQRHGGPSVQAMLDAMGKNIRHMHISDHDGTRDCLPPGTGHFDFKAMIRFLRETGYRGDLIIELYSDGFSSLDELAESMRYIQALLNEENEEVLP